MKRGLFFSLVLHSLLFVGLITGHGGPHKGGNGSEKEGSTDPKTGKGNIKDGLESDHFIPKKETISIEIVEVPSKDGRRKKIPKAKKTEECRVYYGGIGVTLSNINVVVELAKGYSADRAGIKLYDQLIYTGEIRGEVGTPVTFTIDSPTGNKRTVTILRERICYVPPVLPKHGPQQP